MRDAARALYLNKNNSDPAATAQIYNKGLVEQYKKEQTKKNLQQSILDRKEAQMAKKRAPRSQMLCLGTQSCGKLLTVKIPM